MLPVRRRPEADDDLVRIFDYIAQFRTRSAERFLQAAERALQQLARFPRMGSLCESGNPTLAGLRMWRIRRFRKYVILYRETDKGVDVLRVLHSARNLEMLFK